MNGTTTLTAKAEAARKRVADKRRREREQQDKVFLREAKAGAARYVSIAVGKKVPQKALENISAGTYRRYRDSYPAIFFTYDGVEFVYAPKGGLSIRKKCSDCGEYIYDDLHVWVGTGKTPPSQPKLAEIGSFLAKTKFSPYDHTCYETATKALRREADAYARKLNVSAFDLLHFAAEGSL